VHLSLNSSTLYYLLFRSPIVEGEDLLESTLEDEVSDDEWQQLYEQMKNELKLNSSSNVSFDKSEHIPKNHGWLFFLHRFIIITQSWK